MFGISFKKVRTAVNFINHWEDKQITFLFHQDLMPTNTLSLPKNKVIWTPTMCGSWKHHFLVFIPLRSSLWGGCEKESTGVVKTRKAWLYLLRRGLAGSCWGRSSSGPRPWRRCHPDWRGSCCRCRLPSWGRSSATCWASPPPSASPAQLWEGAKERLR